MNQDEYRELAQRKQTADRINSEICDCKADLETLDSSKSDAAMAITALGTRLKSLRQAELLTAIRSAVEAKKADKQSKFSAL